MSVIKRYALKSMINNRLEYFDRMIDRRIIKTKDNIYRTFLELLAKKDFARITVVEICETALISKSTFYTYFEDKFALLEQVVHDYTKKFEKMIKDRFKAIDDNNAHVVILNIMNDLEDNSYALQLLFQIHILNMDLEENIRQILYGEAYQYLTGRNVKTKYPILFIAKGYAEMALSSIKIGISNSKDKEQAMKMQTDVIVKLQNAFEDILFIA